MDAERDRRAARGDGGGGGRAGSPRRPTSACAPGDRIITGVLGPPHPAEPGDRVRLELEAVGAVELAFSE